MQNFQRLAENRQIEVIRTKCPSPAGILWFNRNL
jgi:hypothetical protein